MKKYHYHISEHLIVIASDDLENRYELGWNIVSSPLQLSRSSIDDIFDVDNYCFGLFDQDGGSYSCTDTTSSQIEFQASSGYYMVSEDEVVLDIEGDILNETNVQTYRGFKNSTENYFLPEIFQ